MKIDHRLRLRLDPRWNFALDLHSSSRVRAYLSSTVTDFYSISRVTLEQCLEICSPLTEDEDNSLLWQGTIPF